MIECELEIHKLKLMWWQTWLYLKGWKTLCQINGAQQITLRKIDVAQSINNSLLLLLLFYPNMKDLICAHPTCIC